jgi:hypothetical protein
MIYRIAFCFTVLISAFVQVSTASAQTDPTRVATKYSKIYVPDGYDSNDLVQMVGEGLFRNTCYRHAETLVAVDEATKTISVGPVAYEYKGYCIQIVLPFQRVMDVGILKPGKWTVKQDGGATLTEFTVVPAKTDSADDYLYAPVSQSFFSQDSGAARVIVSGEFTSDCMSLDAEKITVQRDVIVVQPIAKMEARANCVSGKFPFSKSISIPALKAGRYLLHTRSTGGNALNSLVDAI